MSWLAHWRTRAAIERAFAGPVGRRRWRRARAHAARCEACREHYERLAAAAVAFSGAPLPELAIDRIAGEILDGRAPAQRRWWLGAGAAAAAVAAFVIAVLLTSSSTSERPAPQPRGPGFDAALVPGERNPGVRLFCVSAGDSAAEVVHEARAEITGIEAPELRCTIAGELQLAYSTPSLEGMTMIAYSRDSAGELRFYAPRDPSELAVSLAADAIDKPLDWSTRLAASHRAGEHELVIRFFAEPVIASVGASEFAEPVYELRARVSLEEEGTP